MSISGPSDLMVIWGLCVLHVEWRVGKEMGNGRRRRMTSLRSLNIETSLREEETEFFCVLPERVMGFAGIRGCV